MGTALVSAVSCNAAKTLAPCRCTRSDDGCSIPCEVGFAPSPSNASADKGTLARPRQTVLSFANPAPEELTSDAVVVLREGVPNTIMSYADGSMYTGQLVGEQREGHGSWVSPDDGFYEGQWLRGCQDGEGKQQWADGRTYEGQFSGGLFSGRGKMLWGTPAGRDMYEGQYLNNLKHGRGRFVWHDGRTHEGTWVQGQRSGRGVYLNSKGKAKSGVWANDKFEKWDCDDAAAPQ